MAYEQPGYEIVQRYADFELRQYQPYIVAETRVSGEFDRVGNLAFQILAAYIKGNNRRVIALPASGSEGNAPAVAASEPIAMTAPVNQTACEDPPNCYAFSFTMPAQYTLDTLPQPLDPRVKLRQIPAQLIAAVTYSGSWSESRYRQHERQLLDSLHAADLRPNASPMFARYDSPFTLWFLRRNEVLVPVDPLRPR